MSSIQPQTSSKQQQQKEVLYLKRTPTVTYDYSTGKPIPENIKKFYVQQQLPVRKQSLAANVVNQHQQQQKKRNVIRATPIRHSSIPNMISTPPSSTSSVSHGLHNKPFSLSVTSLKEEIEEEEEEEEEEFNFKGRPPSSIIVIKPMDPEEEEEEEDLIDSSPPAWLLPNPSLSQSPRQQQYDDLSLSPTPSHSTTSTTTTWRKGSIGGKVLHIIYQIFCFLTLFLLFLILQQN